MTEFIQEGCGALTAGSAMWRGQFASTLPDDALFIPFFFFFTISLYLFCPSNKAGAVHCSSQKRDARYGSGCALQRRVQAKKRQNRRDSVTRAHTVLCNGLQYWLLDSFPFLIQFPFSCEQLTPCASTLPSRPSF